MSSGVSRGILELAQARRISATSAIVTLDRWAQDGPLLRSVRDRIAIGLHLNLTVGRPLGPMPRLAPDGVLPSIGTLVKAAVSGRLDKAEIEAEVLRQIDRFIAVAGFAPDHVAGHQHVQVLPALRGAAVGAAAIAIAPVVFDDAAFTAAQAANKTILVQVHADWCPQCAAQSLAPSIGGCAIPDPWCAIRLMIPGASFGARARWSRRWG